MRARRGIYGKNCPDVVQNTVGFQYISPIILLGKVAIEAYQFNVKLI